MNFYKNTVPTQDNDSVHLSRSKSEVEDHQHNSSLLVENKQNLDNLSSPHSPKFKRRETFHQYGGKRKSQTLHHSAEFSDGEYDVGPSRLLDPSVNGSGQKLSKDRVDLADRATKELVDEALH